MKQKETYDRLAVGTRLKTRRKQLGWSRRYVADRIGLVEKYYADIERGTCGMSVETLMALTKLYDFSMDALIYGNVLRSDRSEEEALISCLEGLPGQARDCCKQMILLFIRGFQTGEIPNEER